jgi:cell volume regulation protein A
MDFINLPILLFSILLTVSILTSLISSRVGIPLILAFLCMGLAVSAGHIEMLQSLQRPGIIFFIGSVALAMILFDSGFHTSMKNYKQNAKPALLLSTLGVVMTTLFLAPVVHFLLGLNWALCFLLVAIISSTDSAAVFSLLRSKGLVLKERVKSTLEIESGTNDPMAIFLTLSFLFIIQKQMVNQPIQYGFLLPTLLEQAFVGGLIGVLSALLIRALVNKTPLDTALYPIFVLGLTLLCFSTTNVLNGSGFLAVYVAGLILGNTRIQAYAQISKFQQTMTWLSQIAMFTSLGLFVTTDNLDAVWDTGFLLSIALMFLARPLMVFSILHFFKQYTFWDKLFISFVGLRGATSLLLALMPIVLGLPHANAFFDIIFIMVVISLAVQGFMIPIVGRWCGVTLPRLETAPINTQIDLPGLGDSSLIMYQLDDQTPVVLGEKIPRWAKPTLVLRNGVSYPAGTGLRQLKSGDKVYVFLSSELQRPALDKLYGRPNSDEVLSQGDFPLSADITFSELEHLYGISVNKGIRSTSISDLFHQEFADVEIGDRLVLDAIELVVHTIEDGRVCCVGIDFDPKGKHNMHRHIKFLSLKNIKKRLTRKKKVIN